MIGNKLAPIALFLLSSLCPIIVIGQTCDEQSAEQGTNSVCDSEIIEGGRFQVSIDGVRVRWSQTEPLFDSCQVKEQRCRDCNSQSKVQFGDLADMRFGGVSTEYSDSQRKIASALMITDDPDQAEALSAKLLGSEFSTEAARAAAAHRAAHALLQVGRSDSARDLLSELSAIDFNSMPSLAADRVLLNLLINEASMSPADWARADGELTAAYEADPSSFSIRVYRVLAWFFAHRDGRRISNCRTTVTDFLTRILSVSDASPCPLVVAHFEHILDRYLADGPGSVTLKESHFRALSSAHLAYVAQNDALYDAMAEKLRANTTNYSCKAEILEALPL